MIPFLRILRDLFFPPCCVGCGKRLRPSTNEKKAPYFCPDCALEFEKSLLSQCPDCFAAYSECQCQPYAMKRAGSAGLIKLAPYHKEGAYHVVSHAIHSMKRIPRSRVFACCAEELSHSLLKAVRASNEKTPISHTVIVHLPRSVQNVKRYGFDQARELSRALSRAVSYPYLPALKRVRKGLEQKKLTVKERQANLKGAFALTGDVKGCRVILVDDVVTTGAGMAEAIKVLKKGGAAEVLPVCVAVTIKKHKGTAFPKFS